MSGSLDLVSDNPEPGRGLGDFPLIEPGALELNRNPDNDFAEVERAALGPANGVANPA